MKETDKNKGCNIGCVIVTYNRLDKLKRTLLSYSSQTLLPLYLIVVDNASTDGTKDFLDDWQGKDEGFSKIVIHFKENLGGSGGFYIAEEEAIQQNASWVMIADDDAYPSPDYIEGMQQYIATHKDDDISIVCGRVDENGISENTHRTQWRSKWDRNFHIPVKEEAYKKTEFYPDFVSYVGIVVNRDKMKQVGLVNKSNFIWCDDTEHTYRLGKAGKIVCIPAYFIVHDVEPMNEGLSWKHYYGYRNDLMFFKRHFCTHYPFILGKLFIKTSFSFLKGRSRIEIKLRFAAMRDSLFENMGLNKKYRPGWKP